MFALEHLKDFQWIKKASYQELTQLAQKIRQVLLQVVTNNGGHLASNLGVVELTLMLHRCFNFAQDRLVMDVSHQGYVHKLLSGRTGELFERIRQDGGLSGFLNREESSWDAYGGGHAGCALSAALGMAVARDQKQEKKQVVALIGDGTLTNGISFEALNNLYQTKQLVIILNDNDWAIDLNRGVIASYLNSLIIHPAYNSWRSFVKRILKKFSLGKALRLIFKRLKRGTKEMVLSSSFFEHYGLRYIGPINGHDLKELETYLNFCKRAEKPVLLHVKTKKGMGCPEALKDPEVYHGLNASALPTSTQKPYFSQVFGESLTKLAKRDSKIVGITAAMAKGTGLSCLKKDLPKQFFDVGIAEEHAVIFAAGLAIEGFVPVCAIYSTFLHRAIDCIHQDVALQDLSVIFAIDRAGITANDGATHHGLFDMALLKSIPNLILAQPRDGDELAALLTLAVQLKKPFAIRYPRAQTSFEISKISSVPLGKAEILKEGKQIQIWALGPWVEACTEIAPQLEERLGVAVGIVNARFIKPFDEILLEQQARTAEFIVTFEDHVLTGGFGSSVADFIQSRNLSCKTLKIAWPDQFIPHGTNEQSLRQRFHLDSQGIMDKIENSFREAELCRQ